MEGEKGTVNRGRSCIIQPDGDNAPWFAHHFGGVSSSSDCNWGDDAVPRCTRESVARACSCEYAFACPRVSVISATSTQRYEHLRVE